MPSPFPGMNPYLEKPHQWADFHGSFLVCAKAALAAQVRGRYLVHYEQTVYIREAPDELRSPGRPDLSLARHDDAATLGGTATLEAPERFELADAIEDEFRQGYLEILDRESRTVVATIELLSPAHKAPGTDRDRYLDKRRQLLASPSHFVEIDLLRGGPRLPLEVRPKRCDYYALVSRVESRPVVEFWRLGLRDPLPTIPVPLKAGDGDVWLDLKDVLDRVYDEGTFADEVYATPPEPPLSPADAKWAKKFVPSRP